MHGTHYTTPGKYIDPTVDAGFKILFGREESKEILISLLNSILAEDLGERIESVIFLDKEKVKETNEERSVVFDLHCTTDTGKRLIVEMQNLEQEWFVERCLFYGCRAVTEQGKSGLWDYEYAPVISIAFTNFTSRRFSTQRIADGAIIDRHSGKPVTDRLRLIFIQLPEFRQESPEECVSELEQWVYTIKNMKNMESIPFHTTNPIFLSVDRLARMENLTQDERREYDRGLKFYRDIQNQYAFGMKNAIRQGRAEGRAEGRVAALLANLKALIKKLGCTVEQAMDMLDVSAEERPMLQAQL